MPKLFGLDVSQDVYALNSTEQPQPKPTPKPRQKGSKLERKFAHTWQLLNGPQLQTEYRFHPSRRWRFDFAHPATRVAVEVEGGTRQNGRHNRHEGFRGDCEKYNAAALMNWRVFRLTSDMITPQHLEPIIELLRGR